MKSALWVSKYIVQLLEYGWLLLYKKICTLCCQRTSDESSVFNATTIPSGTMTFKKSPDSSFSMVISSPTKYSWPCFQICVIENTIIYIKYINTVI